MKTQQVQSDAERRKEWLELKARCNAVTRRRRKLHFYRLREIAADQEARRMLGE